MASIDKAAGAIEFEYNVPFPEPTAKNHTTQVSPWLQKRYLVDGDGKTLLIGRVNPQGNPDSDFAPDGFVNASLDELPVDSLNPPQVSGLIVNANGQVIGGLQSPTGLGLARFTENGELDTAFGVQGTIIHPIAVEPSTASTTLSDNGSINASGGPAFVSLTEAAGDGRKFYAMAGRRFDDRFTLLRCQENGQLDTTFNNSGKVRVKHPDFETDAMAVVAAPDGGAIVAGTLGRGRSMRVFFSRFNADGTVDRQFGEAGYAIFDAESAGIPAARLFQMELTSIVRLADNGYAASGYLSAHSPGENYGLLIRIDDRGRLALAFNKGKPLLFRHPDGEASFLLGGITEQKDGKLVVAGGVSIRTGGYKHPVLVVRYTSEGELDLSWAPTGWNTYEPCGYTVCYVQSVVLDENQKILISGDGGMSDNAGDLRGFVMQLTV
ncbi:hypothetical protein ACQKO6_11010 [Pseudomonas monteilii]